MSAEPHIKKTISLVPPADREALLEDMLEKYVQYFGPAATGQMFPVIARHWQDPFRGAA
jgi:hypothetical protein